MANETQAAAPVQAPAKSKYKIRKPFAIHLVWIETVDDEGGGKKKVRREQSYFHGMGPCELSDKDALAHMHKLEPLDDHAKELFGEFHDKQAAAIEARQARDGNTKSIAAQVAELVAATVPGAVIQALQAAGIIKGKEAKT